jgi:hypothetical protein
MTWATIPSLLSGEGLTNGTKSFWNFRGGNSGFLAHLFHPRTGLFDDGAVKAHLAVVEDDGLLGSDVFAFFWPLNGPVAQFTPSLIQFRIWL